MNDTVELASPTAYADNSAFHSGASSALTVVDKYGLTYVENEISTGLRAVLKDLCPRTGVLPASEI